MNWQDEGLCAQVGPEMFFLDVGQSSKSAKEMCRSCPVLEQCREYAIVHDERFGIWGAMSERERKKERTARGLPPMCQICHRFPLRGPKSQSCQECSTLFVRPRTKAA